MIPARKHLAFNFVLRRWMAVILGRRFHSIRLAGGSHLRALASPGGGSTRVVGCVNHTNWWDGFILYVLSHHRLPHDIYLAMEEKNLRRYRFFTWMGVFGVDLDSRGSALPGLRYAVKLLRGNPPDRCQARDAASRARLIWMFVQGALVSPRKPVVVKPGATFLARQAGAVLLPLVLRYDWLLESRASVFAYVGEPLPATTSPEELAARLDELLAQTDAAIDRRDFSGWEELLPPRMSMNKRWDHLVHLVSSRRGAFDRQNG